MEENKIVEGKVIKISKKKLIRNLALKYLVKFLPYLFFYHILRLFYSLNQNKNKIDYIYK